MDGSIFTAHDLKCQIRCKSIRRRNVHANRLKFGYLRGLGGNVGTDFQNFYMKQFKASVLTFLKRHLLHIDN